MTLEQREIEDVKQYARNKNQRFKRECELMDYIRNASPLRMIYLPEYRCTVEDKPTWGMSETGKCYAVYRGCAYDRKDYDREFEYLDELAEYIVANY